MKHNVKAPSVGESITEVSILKWAKENGQAVKTGDLLLEIESDKATVEIVAEQSGVLNILKPAGERIPIGEIVAVIDDAGTATTAASAPAAKAPAAPTPTASAPAAMASAGAGSIGGDQTLAPSVRRMVTETGADPSKIPATGKDGRLTKGDVINYQSGSGATAAGVPLSASSAPAQQAKAPAPSQITLKPGDRRVPMTTLRARIAERLVQAQHTAAILTTFNECDMTEVNKVRAQYKDKFKAKHGVNLSFMSFFTRATIEALKLVPEVNAQVDGRDVIYHDYHDIGIAVGSDRGLVVPVLREAGKMGFLDIEKKIGELAVKARDGKLSIADMTGGTFTISNGGTYGSLMSTPILNAPQSGILGMHKIQDRPMVVDRPEGKSIEIRPMMYLALSYDHRLIDGKGAVTFLVHLKDFIENPAKLNLDFVNGL
jgi:2-oxoglutarate dehydrogenase E2 component (dihydrolipoamide succinyltransferase)